MIQLFWSHTKRKFMISLVISFIIGLMLPIRTILIQKIIDSATKSFQYKQISRDMVFWILVFLQILIVGVAVQKIEDYVQLTMRNDLEKSWGKDIFERCSKIKYQYFEKQDTYVVIERLMNNFRTNAIDAVNAIPMLVSMSVSIVGIIAYIIHVDIKVLIVLLITSIPIWILSVISALKERSVWSECYPNLLRAKYLSSVVTSRDYIKEARLNQYNSYIDEHWKKSLYKFQHGVFHSNLKERNITAIFIMFQYFAITVVIFTMLKPLSLEAISVGVFVATAQTLWSIVGSLQYDIIDINQKFKIFNHFQKDCDTIYTYEMNPQETFSRIRDYKSRKYADVVFQDVWFRYSDNDEYILRGVSFSIHNGETIALVGSNGSGKTTIVKLILGLLAPSSGHVYINSIEAKDIDSGLKKQIMSAVFQDFSKYNLTLKENIALRSADRENDSVIKTILASLCDVEKLMSNLPLGVDTILGKNVDNGVDLSGGQWQTVAIARSLYANTPMVIMDEPTASLDPIAESEVYGQLANATKDKTVIFITHRLGSAKFADKILTLEQGEIIEQGSHDDLVNREGVYAKMFRTQKQWYK